MRVVRRLWQKRSRGYQECPKVLGRRSLTTVYRPGGSVDDLLWGCPRSRPGDRISIKFTVMNTRARRLVRFAHNVEYRENKGYTYSPNSVVWNRYKTGYWYENADVTTEATGASIKEILFEIDRLQKEAPSEAELQGIKNYMVGIYVLQNSTRNGVIGQLESMNYNELDKNYLDTYVQKVSSVTAKDVQDVAKKYLMLDRMTFVVVGDKSKIDEQLKPYEVQ